MQTLLLPAVRPGTTVPAPVTLSPALLRRRHLTHRPPNSLSLPHKQPASFSHCTFLSSCSDPFGLGLEKGRKLSPLTKTFASYSPASYGSSNGDLDKAKLAQVAKRLESTSRYFRRLGSLGFWGQLVCTVVAAVILAFSAIVTGKMSSPPSFYATAGGIAAAFISVFWSFGYIRLSDKLRKTANDPSKAPPRADVVKSLKNGIVLNLLGMGSTILGMQATVGLLVAKALTSSANPYYQGISSGYSPVLALDVFLVQASANTILSHFLGLVSSLELLRSVALPPTETMPIPKVA